jgi:hypothetical protein
MGQVCPLAGAHSHLVAARPVQILLVVATDLNLWIQPVVDRLPLEMHLDFHLTGQQVVAVPLVPEQR